MIKIAVASKNPVKINAVKKAFEKLFGEPFVIDGQNVSSGVPDQPLNNEETFRGALNRVEHLSEVVGADYWVGIEGGLEERSGEFEVFAWAVVKSKEGKFGKGRTATFFLPKAIGDLIKAGKELAHASDIVFNETNSGHKQGTVGILTANAIDRTAYYVDPVIMAFIPFKNSHLY